MGDKVITSIVAILTGAIGLAALAVLVSSNAKTSEVLRAGGSTFADIIGAAVAPVSGGLVGGIKRF